VCPSHVLQTLPPIWGEIALYGCETQRTSRQRVPNRISGLAYGALEGLFVCYWVTQTPTKHYLGSIISAHMRPVRPLSRR